MFSLSAIRVMKTESSMINDVQEIDVVDNNVTF